MSSSSPYAAFDPAATALESGITLLEASAGTGKTYSLTTVAVRLLTERKVESLDRVLLVTFTEAATAELKERLRRRVTEALDVLRGADTEDDALREVCAAAQEGAPDRLTDALLRFDEVGVRTIHGFCAHLLQESAFELGQPFDEEAGDAGTAFAAQAVRDAWREAVHPQPAWFGGMVASLGLYPSSFDGAFGDRLLHPHAILQPEADDFESFLSRGAPLWAELIEAWDASRLEALVDSSPAWKKDGRELGYPSALADRLHQAGSRPDPDLTLKLTPRHLEKTAGRKGMKGDGGWDDFFSTEPLGIVLSRWSELADELPAVLRRHLLEAAGRRYEGIKSRAGLLDFDDLIERVHRQLRDPVAGPALKRRVRSRLDVALIDEFQDTDQRQWEIFHDLFADARLILVGDPKQAIYGFRGADVFAYMRAGESAERRTTLTRNWRSHPDLVDAVVHLFRRRPQAFVFASIDVPRVTGAVEAETVSLRGDPRPPLLIEVLGETGKLDAGEARRVAIERTVAEIRRSLDNRTGLGGDPGRPARAVHPGDLAVLVRRRTQGREVVEALRSAGIPSVLSAMGDIYHSDEMNELGVVLEAILWARHRGRRQRAAATLLWGADLEQTRALLEDEEAETILVESLENLRARWREQGLVGMAAELFRSRRLRSRMLALDDGERRFTNYQHAVEILARDGNERDLEGEALLRWIRRARRTEDAAEERELRLEKDAEAVQVVTMHGSKGLEYEIVFCPFLWDSTTRSKKDRAQLVHEEIDGRRREVLDFGGSESARADRARAESLAEDLRLAYVAITRARRRCVITVANAGQSPQSTATAFLLDRTVRDPGESDESWVRRCQESAKDVVREIGAAVDALCREAPESIGRVEDGELQAQPPEPPPEPEELAARRFPAPRSLRSWTHTSFTNMTRRAPVVDRPDHFDPVDAELTPASSADGIGAFARGARAGICLHEVLEEIDFAGNLEGVSPRVERILDRHGLETPAAHVAPIDPAAVVLDLLAAVQAEPFGDEGFKLGELDRSSRVHEWAFEARLGADQSVNVGELTGIFARHATGSWKNDLTARLGRLPDERWRGLLRGFVDLVFERDGRWWVVDWKSNYLGPRPEDYGEAPLLDSMLTHHYLLQYHLYLVALHRHLRVRLPDYDPARQLGGAAYVFLRGLRGDGRRGWFVDRPPVALIEALDRGLDGKGER